MYFTLTSSHLSSDTVIQEAIQKLGRWWGQLHPGLSELNQHRGLGTLFIPWKRKALVPLCSPGTWRTPVVDSSSSNSVKTSICKEGSTPSPQTGGSGGKRRKERKSYIKIHATSSRAAKNRVCKIILGTILRMRGDSLLRCCEPYLRSAAKL